MGEDGAMASPAEVSGIARIIDRTGLRSVRSPEIMLVRDGKDVLPEKDSLSLVTCSALGVWAEEPAFVLAAEIVLEPLLSGQVHLLHSENVEVIFLDGGKKAALPDRPFVLRIGII